VTIEVVALDGDDTLWHSEQLFADTQAQFCSLVEPYVVGTAAAADLHQRLLEVERRNLPIFGYGVKGFTLALVETAIEVTGGAVRGHDLQAILDLGKALMEHPVELLDGVEDTIDELAGRYRLMVVTKGDLLHQESKLARSGLADRLWAVEIVSEKDRSTYGRILDRHRIDPRRFLMAGNSVRSDVLPVLELGGHAVHVPYHLTWELEAVAADPRAPRYPVLGSLKELPRLVDELTA
jgi:putative hydrolase of the HAD superfamily